MPQAFNYIIFTLIFVTGCSSEWNTTDFPGQPLETISLPDEFVANIKTSKSGSDLSCVFYSETHGHIDVLGANATNLSHKSAPRRALRLTGA